MKKIIKKKKQPVTITVTVMNKPSANTILNTAKILKTLGTSA
jgi:hypothetical protein